MVCDTSSGGGLPTCQKRKAYLERRKSYSPDTICYGCTNQVDLEVKIQGQRSPTMVHDTSFGGGLPTCQIWKACLERQKSYSPDTICYGHTDRLITIRRLPQSGGALIKSLSYKMCCTPVIFNSTFRWQFFSGKRYFNDILWAQAYNNNTLLLVAIRYKKTRSMAIER
jgi:hypothetical protein